VSEVPQESKHMNSFSLSASHYFEWRTGSEVDTQRQTEAALAPLISRVVQVAYTGPDGGASSSAGHMEDSSQQELISFHHHRVDLILLLDVRQSEGREQ
jgi:hypothetical protein